MCKPLACAARSSRGAGAARFLGVLLCLLGASSARLGFAEEALPPVGAPVQDTIPPKPVSDLTAAYPEGATGDAVVVLTLTVERDGSVSRVDPNQAQEPFSSAAV